MKIEKRILDNLYSQLEKLIQQARQNIVQAVNLTMVATYYEIGKIIVENEQEGEERAKYGTNLLKNLSERLKKDFGKGFSVQNLENMRKFYLTYSKSQTLSRKSESHYLKIMNKFLQVNILQCFQVKRS